MIHAHNSRPENYDSLYEFGDFVFIVLVLGNPIFQISFSAFFFSSWCCDAVFGIVFRIHRIRLELSIYLQFRMNIYNGRYV